MSKRHPAARYLLPETEDFSIVYACVPIPDEVNHRAAFWGQMLALSSARVWANDDDHGALVAAETWKNNIENIVIADACNSCPGFALQYDDIYCPQSEGLVTVRPILMCDDCDAGSKALFSRSNIDIDTGNARIGYTAWDLTFDNIVGGHICQVRAYATGITTSPDWVLQWRDCLDNDFEEIQNDDYEFNFTDFEAQKLCLTCNSNFCAVVTWDGPILCSPA